MDIHELAILDASRYQDGVAVNVGRMTYEHAQEPIKMINTKQMTPFSEDIPLEMFLKMIKQWY